MKLKCNNCGNDKEFVNYGTFNGPHATFFDSDGKCTGVSDILEATVYKYNKKVRCSNCEKVVCNYDELVGE